MNKSFSEYTSYYNPKLRPVTFLQILFSSPYRADDCSAPGGGAPGAVCPQHHGGDPGSGGHGRGRHLPQRGVSVEEVQEEEGSARGARHHDAPQPVLHLPPLQHGPYTVRPAL